MITEERYSSFDGENFIDRMAYRVDHPMIGIMYIRSDDEGRHFCDLVVQEMTAYVNTDLDTFVKLSEMVRYGKSINELALYRFSDWFSRNNGATIDPEVEGFYFDIYYTSEFDRRFPEKEVNWGEIWMDHLESRWYRAEY